MTAIESGPLGPAFPDASTPIRGGVVASAGGIGR